MAKYDGLVVLKITTTVQVRLECEAESEAEAEAKLRWQGLGLGLREAQRLASQPEGEVDGSETTVEQVWGVDTMPTSIKDF
jgi:hypothetical protein